jgi:CHAT domain-containing protein
MGYRQGELVGLSNAAEMGLRQGDFERALTTARRARALARELGQGPGKRDLDVIVAGCLEGLIRYAEALEAYESARRDALAAKEPREAARIAQSAGIVCVRMGRPAQALKLLDVALREYEQVGERLNYPGALVTRASALRRLRRTDEALRDFERALALYDERKDEGKIAEVWLGMGMLYWDLGRFREAASLYEQAVPRFERAGNRSKAALARGELGNTYATIGRFAGALELMERAYREHRELGVKDQAASVLGYLAQVQSALGDSAAARDLYLRSAAELRALGLIEKADQKLMNAVRHEAALGRSDVALEALEELEARSRSAGRVLLLAQAQSLRAQVLAGVGKLAEAVELLERTRPDEGTHVAAESLILLGTLHRKKGRLDRAIEVHERARALIEGSTGGHANLWNILVELAEDRLAGGEAEAALALARSALEQNRSQLHGLGETSALQVQKHGRGACDLGLRAVQAIPARERRQELDAAAFSLAEAGRALLLSEGLVNREAILEARVSPELHREHARARGLVEERRQRFDQLLASGSPDRAALAAAREEEAAAYRDFETVVARIQREVRSVGDFLFPRPIEVEQARALVPKGTALVHYHLLEDQALALVLTQDRLERVTLAGSAGIVRQAESWLALAARDGSEDEPAAAAALYDLLVRPIEPSLAGQSRLLISPDGVLALLPFEALLRKEGARAERMLERWEVAYVASATVQTTLLEEERNRTVGSGIVALGDPVYPGEAKARPAATTRDVELRGLGSLARLPESGEEARTVAAFFPETTRAVLLRDEATLARLRAALERPGRLRALHLACHGFVDTRRPRLSGLVLGGGEVLCLDDIYGLRIDADLAVLSACDTGRGVVERGEGVLGLVRGFFLAGCPHVVVTDWKVDDTGTSEVMTAFYRRMVTDGAPPAAALRGAKLEVLGRGGAKAHPSRWAAFVLWGLPD